MLLLLVLLRFSAITLAVATIYLMLRDGHKHLVARVGALLLVAIVAMLMLELPGSLRLPRNVEFALHYASGPILPLVWWFGMALLEDRFRLHLIHWAGMLLFTALVSTNLTSIFGGGTNFLQVPILLMSYVLLVHLAIIALKGLKEDLVDQRRKTRVALVVFLVFGEIVTLAPTTFLSGITPIYIHLMNLSITFVVVVWAFLMSTRFHAEVLTFVPVQAPEPKAPAIDPRDAALDQRLSALMVAEAAYTEHGLTIARLAKSVEVPEHQLRAHINQGLGYRNFSEYLNNYRIQYAKTVLSDPGSARISIITIAMDSGFASVSSFNRVFKDLEAITPTEFRSGILARSAHI